MAAREASLGSTVKSSRSRDVGTDQLDTATAWNSGKRTHKPHLAAGFYFVLYVFILTLHCDDMFF